MNFIRGLYFLFFLLNTNFGNSYKNRVSIIQNNRIHNNRFFNRFLRDSVSNNLIIQTNNQNDQNNTKLKLLDN
jgi:hypothetical protein